MPRVVLDTNIFISAILTPGPSRRIIEMARRGTVEVALSEAILSEIERVLRLKLRWADWQIEATLRGIRDMAAFVSPGPRLSVIAADDADNRVLECALVAKADYIVSGDRRHLLPLREFHGIKILSPSEFCQVLQTESDA